MIAVRKTEYLFDFFLRGSTLVALLGRVLQLIKMYKLFFFFFNKQNTKIPPIFRNWGTPPVDFSAGLLSVQVCCRIGPGHPSGWNFYF